MGKDEILIVKMYSGSYLNDDYNIGHEAINLFKADDGNNYIYVCPLGWISKKHNDRIKTIFLVRNAGENELELLAIVPAPEQVLKITYNMPKFVKHIKDKKIDVQKNNENHEKYLMYKKLEASKPELKEIITKTEYGGVNIEKIFIKNKNNDEDTFSHVTFKAKDVILVSEDYKNKFNEIGIKLKRDRLFVDKNTQNEKYTKLQEFADEVGKNCTTKACKFSEVSNNNEQKFKSSFLKIIRKENDELVISNLLKYVFSKVPEAFIKFGQKFNYKKSFSTKFNIIREKEKNIDLLIVDNHNKNILLIENKIKSNIHGKPDNNGIWISQLEKYKIHVEKEFKDYEKRYIVIAPDYNRFVLNRESDINKEGYILVKYSEIKDFLDKNVDYFKDIDYFDEFIKIINKHSKKYDVTFEEDMFEKFKEIIDCNQGDK